MLTACAPAGNPVPPLPPQSSPAQPTETSRPAGRPVPDWVTEFGDPILLAIHDRPPAFQDDFSQPDSEWVSATGGEEPFGTIAIADGALTMNLESGQFPVNTTLDMRFENFVLQVDVDLQQLNRDKGAEIQWGGGYSFMLTPPNGWVLYYYGPPDPTLSSGEAPADFSEPVTITIISKAPEIAVYLNGIPLTYYDDIERPSITYPHIRIGLWARPPNVESHSITYDNLRTWNLDPLFPPSWVTEFSDPILLAIQDRPPDFQDDFSQDTNGWLVKTWPLDRKNEVFANGAMNLGLEQGATADHLATSFRDFIVQVDIEFLDLNSEKGVSLEWLRYEVYDDTMKLQRFTLNSDNWWGLRSCSPMEPPECQEGPNGTADVDPSEPITIKLISKGTQLAVYLNGTPLVYYNYLGQPSGSHIRLIAMDNPDSPGHLGTAFDNFKIWELQSAFPPPAPDPALVVGSSWNRPADGMVMMYVPEGEFLMGSDVGDPSEQPVHAVYLDAFWIDQTEVTNAMFARFLSEMGNQKVEFFEYLPPEIRGVGVTWLNPYGAQVYPVQGDDTWHPWSGYEDHPVINANWFGAQAYCAWVGGRLPTEAEWEKAARGGLEGSLYPWGDEPPVCTLGASNGAWLGPPCGPPPVTMPPVGSYTPNGYGLYDMVGSVREWAADLKEYKKTWDYFNSPYRNPLGAIGPLWEARATRGPLALTPGSSVQISTRKARMSYQYGDELGFRCVRSP
jgi:formylglycine-generating enzyme required for sulfatase activity